MDYVGNYIYINNSILCDIFHYEFSCGYSLFRISCTSCEQYYQIISLLCESDGLFHYGDFMCTNGGGAEICLYVSTKTIILNMVKYGYIIKNNTDVLDKMLKRKVGNNNFEDMLSWESRACALQALDASSILAWGTTK